MGMKFTPTFHGYKRLHYATVAKYSSYPLPKNKGSHVIFKIKLCFISPSSFKHPTVKACCDQSLMSFLTNKDQTLLLQLLL